MMLEGNGEWSDKRIPIIGFEKGQMLLSREYRDKIDKKSEVVNVPEEDQANTKSL